MIARAIIVATAIGVKLAGLYAGIITFGVLNTLGIYTIGALTAVLQHHILVRTTSC